MRLRNANQLDSGRFSSGKNVTVHCQRVSFLLVFFFFVGAQVSTHKKQISLSATDSVDFGPRLCGLFIIRGSTPAGLHVEEQINK